MPELDFERITLNAIPDGELPVFHASQFETMRPFIADLKWGNEDFAPGEGCWCTLSIRKTDDTLVVLDELDIVNNEVSCILSQQSVACAGDNFCQLKVWAEGDEEDGCIACLNFILHVQPDPEAGGITSESEINNLTEQIEEITQQVIGDDYYDKTEVDDLLDLKADKTTTYTKTEVNNALNLKADKSTTYTKTQTDNLLNDKADKSNTYTKTQVDNALALKANTADLATVATTGDYDDLTNKPTIPAAQVQSDYAQADNTKVDYIKNKPDLSVFVTSDALSEIIYELLPAGTASGAIANFDTDLSLPLVECKANIVATGGYSDGTPHAINGYTEANIARCGKNLIDDSKKAYLSNTITLGAETYQGKCCYLPAGTYTISVTTLDGNSTNLYGKDLDDNVSIFVAYNVFNYSFTLTKGTNVSFWVYKSTYTSVNDITSAQVELGSTATAYTPYNGTTYAVSWQDEAGTVYGGSLDVTTGVLTVTHDYIASYNGETINEPWISSMDEYVPNTSPSTGAQVVYPLTTPVTYNITPVQINALLGVNNVFNDTNGDTEVQYKEGIQHYIDTRI